MKPTASKDDPADSASARAATTPTPLRKQALVGLLVGGTLGPVVGWFVGTFATFFVVAAVSEGYYRGARVGLKMSAFFGGMLGIPLGLVTGLIAGVPVRIAFSSILRPLAKPWAGAVLGLLPGAASYYLIDQFWDAPPAAAVYLLIHSLAVGAVVGAVAVIAKPKWL